MELASLTDENFILLEEKSVLLDGQCFGEWELINKKERTSSALCMEDSDLLLINLNAFNYSFNVKNLINYI